MIAIANVVMSASAHVSTPTSRATDTTIPTTTGRSDTRPLPGRGNRASVSPRCRRDRPVAIMNTRMMASGTACASPVSDGVLIPNALAMSGWNSEISLCTMPMPSAASTVIPNDEKRPTSAAASAGRTASDRTTAFSPTMGARKIAASADNPPAIAKFAISMRSGDHPALAATRRFSATAEVARPNSVPE